MLFAGGVIIERWSQVGNFPIIGDVALKGIVGLWPLSLSLSFISPSSGKGLLNHQLPAMIHFLATGPDPAQNGTKINLSFFKSVTSIILLQ
jgi:hypothetical protein